MTTFVQELRQAWRSLLQRKAYFVACAGTLTLVLGANAAMCAVVNATMLRPMPFATTGEVVHLFSQPPGTTGALPRNPLQQMEVPRIRERARTLARLEGYLLSERVITLNQEPGIAPTATVTTGLLSIASRLGTPWARASSSRACTASCRRPPWCRAARPSRRLASSCIGSRGRARSPA